MIAIDDEVDNYDIQLVQDLADYHKDNQAHERQFIVDENVKLIKAKL